MARLKILGKLSPIHAKCMCKCKKLERPTRNLRIKLKLPPTYEEKAQQTDPEEHAEQCHCCENVHTDEEDEIIWEGTFDEEAINSHVTFAEKNLTLYTSFDGETIEEETTPPVSPKEKIKPTSQAKSTKKVTPRRQREDDIFVGAFAAISPSDHFIFCPVEGEKEYVDILTIANISEQQIAFKVKTTSPDGYRVRPSTGLVKPQNAAEVNIFLQAGHEMSQVPKDRFLVMAMKVDNSITSANQLATLWKSAPKDAVTYMDHRLSCQLTSADGLDPPPETNDVVVLKETVSKLNSQIEQLLVSQRRVDRRVTCLFVFQIMVAISVGLFITVIVILSLLDIDINPLSNKYTAACTPWRYQ